MQYTDSPFSVMEKLLGDKTYVKFNNESVQMKDVRKIESKYGQKFQDKLKRILVFWDDVVQFTTLGSIDLLMETLEIDDSELGDEISDEFFYRPVELTDGIDFTVSVFKSKFDMELDPDSVRNFFEVNYVEILRRSPVSTMFVTIIRMESILRSIKLCFKHKFSGIDKFILSFSTHLLSPAKVPVTYMTYMNYTEECKLLEHFGKDHDIIMTVKMSEVYMYIEETKTTNMVVMGPNIHNGLDEFVLLGFYKVHGDTKTGPLNSEIIFYDEGLAIC